MKKQIVSTLLALCMLLCLMPTAAFAEDSTETPPVCSCETACTADNMNTECPVCGAENSIPQNCGQYIPVEDRTGENGSTERADDPNGPTELSAADQVQAMIDGLPNAEEITEDNAEEVKAQLEAIDEAKEKLSDEEFDELDMTRYAEAAAALGALAAPMLLANDSPNEQFSLAPGGRYYFDLSAMGIPGTVNSTLDGGTQTDGTLHYVPFTYVGTVDAYSLDSAADTDTTSYEHSLFIANYNVTHFVSWDALNEKGLIFGKTYSSGSIDYTMRAPSAGTAYNGHYGESGIPANNEWDTILKKSGQDSKDNTTGYIKNWWPMASWGQDTWSNDTQSRTLRGYTSAHFCYGHPATGSIEDLGYRPVLELPTDLAADSLKVVALGTAGHMPGETYNSINIIVKKGESFKAPSAEGLPLSDDISADTPMWWVDENGNFYKPGDTVPADVSMLSAFYGGLGLFLDRGDGEVEVTPDNYTDIFGDGTASFVLPKGKTLTSLEESYNLTSKDILEIYSTGKTEKYGSVFPNLKLKNADLTSVRLSKKYIGRENPLFITLDGKNTIGSLNRISMSRNTLSVLGDGSLTLNSALTLSQYTQYGGSSVTMTDGLTAYYLSIDSGSLTVTGDPQVITLRDQDISDLYMGDGMRLFTGSSAQDAAEAVIPQLSAEMQEVYQRYLAEDNTLTNEEFTALSNALKERFNAIFRQLPGKTYVRITGAWDVTYQPGTDGSGSAVTDIKFYNDALTLRNALFTRTGYTQTGWATVDGGEKIYGLDAVYTQNEALTLYPVWNANKYTITFDTAGGSEIASITQDYGTRITAPANPTREGYTFTGWDRDIPATMPAHNMTVTAQWKDSEKPTGEIKICENSWKAFLSNITFGLFFKDAQTVTVTAADNSGKAVTVEYLLSDKALTESELAGMTFTTYSAPFSINPDNEYVIYAKLTDTSGNFAYINTNGIVLDATVPVISGIEAGKTYCAAQTITVDEKYIGTVKVNGTKVSLDENSQFALSPASGEQTIVVTDKAGNETRVTVTVNNGHTYEWQSENGQYWQKCKFCNHETAKKDIPTINISGADKVCRTQDYKFSFTLPEGATGAACGYEFIGLGGAPLTPTVENGLYSGIIKASTYPAKENSFKLIVSAKTADGFAFSAEKKVTIQNEHTGGTATCKDKAICEVCGESYGKLDPNNHANLKHIDAKAATKTSEGNIEYWYCDGCNKYYKDAKATQEITKADTVTPKLSPKITAGDGATVTQGEKKELSFTSDASFADFLRVELDGTTLDEKNYTKKEGSTIITLNRDFVATLSVGEHTLAIVSKSGTATAKFTVKAKPAETATPQPTVTLQPTVQPQPTAQPQPTVQPVSPIPSTGDTANPALWFALLIVSGFALAAIFVLRRKGNRK